jgi:hypothetical protein
MARIYEEKDIKEGDIVMFTYPSDNHADCYIGQMSKDGSDELRAYIWIRDNNGGNSFHTGACIGTFTSCNVYRANYEERQWLIACMEAGEIMLRNNYEYPIF